MDTSWINMQNPVALWWLFLVAASCINIIFWLKTLFYLRQTKKITNTFSLILVPQNLIWFSSIYVFGCTYRSFFPKADVQRIALFDNYLSSVFLGRTVATFAELAFVCQWAILLYFYGNEKNKTLVVSISRLLVPLIIIAEVFSWYAVITTNYIGNSVEESLWALCYFLIFIALFNLRSAFSGSLRKAIDGGLLGCAMYVGFMLIVDVPMYINRWLEDQFNGKTYFTFKQGLVDLNTRWVITHDIKDWASEIPWMSLYFSAAVLISIALCYVSLPATSPCKVPRH